VDLWWSNLTGRSDDCVVAGEERLGVVRAIAPDARPRIFGDAVIVMAGVRRWPARLLMVQGTIRRGLAAVRVAAAVADTRRRSDQDDRLDDEGRHG
jgi:hypothetical protein